ncbi:unnamed protein product [Paramecium octaurelia]|uniref:Uncharacterized protein n=1 Tax=Paramecium octaurelia TaxID=43137 RepID=A0A8S1UB62_PAROT|nr:unnamed protein product [Paramecium octaurelia]
MFNIWMSSQEMVHISYHQLLHKFLYKFCIMWRQNKQNNFPIQVTLYKLQIFLINLRVHFC